jgi:ADP-glucose pyrophosphorylase
MIKENTQIENSILWQNVKAGKNTVIENCIITSDCIIEDNVHIENSILYKNANGDQLTMYNWQTN